MTLSELKKEIDAAIENVIERGESADDITVSIQIDACDGPESIYCDDVELCYDSDAQCSGCVIFGEMTGKD